MMKFKFNFLKTIFFLIFILICGDTYCQNKIIRLHFISCFKKNESFRIWANDSIYLIKNSSDHLYKAIDILLPSGFKIGERIPVYIEHKYWFSIGYKSTELDIYYEPDMKYLFIRRDHRQKGRYAIEYYWTNRPPNYFSLKLDGYYDSDSIPLIFRPDKVYVNKNIKK